MIEYNPEQQKDGSPLDGASACVVGIGGAGANVLDRIALENLVEIELVSMNTDIRALTNAVSSKKVQLGAEITRGLGAGGDPELGLEAARGAEQAIREVLKEKTMVFLCVGLGGGTGSGAAPLVAEIAREMGVFVVVFATMPFSFEGRRRVNQAKSALARIEEVSDALIVFENDMMGQLVVSKSGVQEAFAAADQMIAQSVRAVTTLVVQPGLIRIGMDDLMTALRNTDSRCLFGYGSARGKNRAQEALKRAMKSPLLDSGKMIDRAGSVLVHILGGESMTLHEVELLMKELAKCSGDQANVLFGVGVDQKLGESMSVTVISSISESAEDPVEEEAVEVAEVEEEQVQGSESIGGQDHGAEERADDTNDNVLPAASPEEAGVVETPGDAEPTDAGSGGQVEMELLCGDGGQAGDETGIAMNAEVQAEDEAETSRNMEGAEPQAEEPGEADDAGREKEPSGGLRLNLLPKVFGLGKDKAKPAAESSRVSDETSSANHDEADGSAEEKSEEQVAETGDDSKASVIASFVDRSKKGDEEMAAMTAEPMSAPGAEESQPAEDAGAESGDRSAEDEQSGESVDQGALALDEGKAGRFVKGEPTIVDGEDLDVPTFLRRKGSS